jgi:nucleoside-triphosphatase
VAWEDLKVMAAVNVLLLTGAPGVGKTTVLRNVAGRLPNKRVAGFYTEEIRTLDGERSGFRMTGFDGHSGVMAQSGFPSPYRVGKYGVDVTVIDDLALSFLAQQPSVEIYLVDEIGKMECVSEKFVAAMRKVLDFGKPVVATIALHGAGFIDEVKRRSDIQLWQVTRANRDILPDDILAWLAKR